MNTNKLVLKSINQLFEYSFFIPSYQRGYRWTETQVTQLLDDIWQFAKNPQPYELGAEKPFYCLQPIVVKRYNENEKELEVIDGQQRLTTIFLILKNLAAQIERDQKNFTRIFFQTRVDSEDFLKKIDESSSEKNIDYFHICAANKIIGKWFQDKANTTEDASPRAFFTPTFLTNTKVVWYEIDEPGINPIDIFTRINIGKIPLTNAELIKALFLQKSNFNEDKATLKQIQIASEWDSMEKALQDEAFWLFLYNPDNNLKYDNRIEFIFDLMSSKKKDHEFYHTFNFFQTKYTLSKENSEKPDIDALWLSIKKFFLCFEEWFRDRELYHLIGYLIDCKIEINKLKEKSEDITKSEFKEYLKKKIREEVKCQIEELSYNDPKVKKILLLFNVQTIISSNNEEMRFPFYQYKNDNWDIEHVRSQTDRQITINNRKDWSLDVLEYFTGEDGYFEDSEKTKQLEIVSNISDEIVKNICEKLIKILDSDKYEEESFLRFYNEMLEYFHEKEAPKDINNISNLALLDSATNRSYKNAMFPIKRKRIIKNDMSGVFVPIGTKNLFLKFYSKKMGDVMYWNDSDADDYLQVIKQTLINYLPKKQDTNE